MAVVTTHQFGVTKGGNNGRAESWLNPNDEFDYYLSGMVIESVNVTDSKQTDVTDDENGEPINSSVAAFGKRQEAQITLKSKQTSSYAEQTNNFALCVDDNIAVTNISISTSKGAKSTMSVTAHKHLDCGGRSHTLKGGGRATTIPAFPGFGAGTFGLELGVPASSLQSGNYTIEFMHTDEDAADGSFLCGITHGEKHTATFEAIDETEWTIPQGWIDESKGDNESNTQHRRRTLTISKYVPFADMDDQ